MTDASGTLTTAYNYDPYGETTMSGAGNGNTSEYTGRENDGTGLYYYRARYYNPQLGRFISQDPIGFAGGLNLYAYVRDNPLTFKDPFGFARKLPPPCNGGAGGGGGGGGGGFLDQWPFNGNLVPGSGYQDQICSPPIPCAVNNNPAMLKCCQAHDNCYTAHNCNWSSWLGTVPISVERCQVCNKQVVECFVNAIF